MRDALNSKTKGKIRLHSDHIRRRTLICITASECQRMNSEPEAELIARCRRGEARAWDELFDLNYAAAGRFVFQLAPEFTQEFHVASP